MLRAIARLLVAILALAGLAVIVGGAMMMAGGIGARQPPGRLETALASRARSFGIPRAARDRVSPLAPSADAVKDGMEHFADHCAICHANDGSGDTEMGRNLYPRVPDMRLPKTQNLTDGEIFYIIVNGVKLTGMPGWGGDPEQGDAANWKLVQFIRHLPKLTDAEVAQMKKLNPKGPDEREQMDPDEFLKGSAVPAPAKHKHGGETK